MTGTSPPGPFMCGSTTWRTSPVATAASNALPPASRTAIPAADASQCVEATMPNVPASSGLVVNCSLTTTHVSVPGGSMISSARVTGRARAAAAVAFIAAAAATAAGCGSTTTVTAPASGGSSSTSAPASSSAPPPTSPAGPAECVTTSLRVTTSPAGAAAGTAFANIDFTNTGSAACFLVGYPGVSFVSAGSNAGSQIGADAKRDPTIAAQVITLQPGTTAHAALAIVDALNFP